jgi:PAS domain S-box-containing protein
MSRPVAKIPGKEHLWSDPASRAVIRVVLWYALFGVIWILASDHAARLLFPSPELFERASVIKGWLYVVVTAIGLFGLLLAAMRNLRRSNLEAAAYFHTTPAVMQVCDTDLKLEAVNEAGLRLYGGSLEHLQESDWIEQVVAASDRQALRSFMRDALDPEVPAGSGHTMMVHVMASPSTTRTLLCHVSPLADEKGKPAKILLTGLDVTDQEKELEQRSRAEKLESIGMLAGGVAHDFNNALSGILGQLSLARAEWDTPGAAEQHIAHGEAAALSAQYLARQLLTFDRGWQPIRNRADIRPLIENAARLVASGAAIEIEQNMAPDLADIRADRGQIAQVLMNLLLNAKQAVGGVGRIWITAENREVTETNPWGTLSHGRYVSVGITDEGPGLDPVVRARLFEPYFTTKSTGTGLGLATCYSIITKHGGIIEALPGPGGKGATFRFGIPADLSPAEEPAVQDDQAIRRDVVHTGGKILVVDDEAMIRMTTAQLLNHLGYDALAVPDGDSGLAAVRESAQQGERFVGAILDLTIPGKRNGYDIVGELKQLDPHIVAIASSGSSAEFPAGRLSKGFDAFLEKPYTLEQLDRILSDTLQSRNDR